MCCYETNKAIYLGKKYLSIRLSISVAWQHSSIIGNCQNSNKKMNLKRIASLFWRLEKERQAAAAAAVEKNEIRKM